jgi:hypothetical protein
MRRATPSGREVGPDAIPLRDDPALGGGPLDGECVVVPATTACRLRVVVSVGKTVGHVAP